MQEIILPLLAATQVFNFQSISGYWIWATLGNVSCLLLFFCTIYFYQNIVIIFKKQKAHVAVLEGSEEMEIWGDKSLTRKFERGTLGSRGDKHLQAVRKTQPLQIAAREAGAWAGPQKTWV